MKIKRKLTTYITRLTYWFNKNIMNRTSFAICKVVSWTTNRKKYTINYKNVLHGTVALRFNEWMSGFRLAIRRLTLWNICYRIVKQIKYDLPVISMFLILLTNIQKGGISNETDSITMIRLGLGKVDVTKM